MPQKQASDFYKKTSEGLPALGTASIDPLAVPAFDVEFGQDIGVIFKLRNVFLSGIRNQQLNALR